MIQSYVPFIKTTDAELRGYEHLTDEVKDKVLPLFELTRSRKSKNNPIGEIKRRLDSILSLVGDRQFILDLTTHESLSNPEIEELLSDDKYFENWCNYISDIGNRNLIPVVHALEGGDGSEIAHQASNLLEYSNYIAFRVDAFDENVSDYINNFPDKSKLMLLLDAGFIEVGNTHREIRGVLHTIENIPINDLNACVLSASSFPASVVQTGYGQDAYGDWDIEEVILNRETCNGLSDDNKITYGDYASIHPIRYNIQGGGWVPRVDVPLVDSLFYHRYRRDAGGYVEAAKHVLHDPKYSSLGAWGDKQISEAASGDPNGLSPAFWISVRLNLHITRQVSRLSLLS